ncbi:hypothetical protein MAR_012329 [Mya arenaria]|uniref:Uncharacterized protein n=1 Tax=Mya arenaria TaxID=6604 RepID=A0ABY7FXA0_MYAAR|nr:hypothetical protein MAR_012329 [Mya arenaria]
MSAPAGEECAHVLCLVLKKVQLLDRDIKLLGVIRGTPLGYLAYSTVATNINPVKKEQLGQI